MRKKLSAQEVFDIVIRHLHNQGKQAMDPIVQICSYRTSNGLTCAFGCLIPDWAYRPSMEGLRAIEVIQDYKGLSYISEHKTLLQDLQCTHDTSLTRTSLVNSLRMNAQQNDLDETILDSLMSPDWQSAGIWVEKSIYMPLTT